MMRFRYALILGVMWSLVTTAAFAQFPGGGSRPIRLVVSGGLTLPAGDLKDLHDTGFHYDASLLVNIAGIPLTLRPELTFTRLSLKELSGMAGGGSYDDGVTQMFGALGNLELPLLGGLYVLAGGGIMNLKLPDGTGTTSGVSESNFTFDAGAGLRFALGAVSGFVEARVGSASYDQGKFGFTKAQFIPVTFGLVF